MRKIIIMIGPPGSGKGTQAKKIAAQYGYTHISSGDLLRSLAAQPQLTGDEQEAVEKIKSGKLVADSLIYRLVFDKIEKEITSGKGVVLDGVIRNVDQAYGFQKFFEEKKLTSDVLALEIALSDEESLARLSARQVCSKCGEIFPAGFKDVECPKCGGKLIVRSDDNQAVVKERIEKQGNKALAPILDFYTNQGILSVVQGDQPIEDVEKDINNVLVP